MSATITMTFDDGSEIAIFDVPEHVVDSVIDDYLYNFPSSLKV